MLIVQLAIRNATRNVRRTMLTAGMIVAGTSATVYPAAQFPISVQERGGDLIEVNPYESEITPLEVSATALRALILVGRDGVLRLL